MKVRGWHLLVKPFCGDNSSTISRLYIDEAKAEALKVGIVISKGIEAKEFSIGDVVYYTDEDVITVKGEEFHRIREFNVAVYQKRRDYVCKNY